MSLGGPARDDLAASIPAFRPKIDDPIRRFHNFEIMLDHNDRVALIDQLMQHLQEFCDIVEVQSGGRLVENIERAAG